LPQMVDDGVGIDQESRQSRVSRRRSRSRPSRMISSTSG
jgi:hypothetical protein